MTIRHTAASELKDAIQIINADPHGWWAIHTALVSAARQIAAGGSDLLGIAKASLKHTTEAGFGPGRPDPSATRYTGKPIMAWQDALYVVNELPEWRFLDEVLLVAWLIECGGPEMGRGPARASFQNGTAEHYVGVPDDCTTKGIMGMASGGRHQDDGMQRLVDTPRITYSERLTALDSRRQRSAATWRCWPYRKGASLTDPA